MCLRGCPYSAAYFKTLEYRPGFPDRFGSILEARRFCRDFFAGYNQEHRHSGIGLMPPAAVHSGRGEAPLSYSLCRVIASGEPLVVEDAREHPLGGDHPSVWPAGMVAHAGVPLRMGNWQMRGTLCVLDTRPRKWTEEETHYLADLAAVVEIQWPMDQEEGLVGGTRDLVSIADERGLTG